MTFFLLLFLLSIQTVRYQQRHRSRSEGLFLRRPGTGFSVSSRKHAFVLFSMTVFMCMRVCVCAYECVCVCMLNGRGRVDQASLWFKNGNNRMGKSTKTHLPSYCGGQCRGPTGQMHHPCTNFTLSTPSDILVQMCVCVWKQKENERKPSTVRGCRVGRGAFAVGIDIFTSYPSSQAAKKPQATHE